MESNDLYQSARSGILPPGVNTKTWFDADHAWAYGMSVYVPSLTNARRHGPRRKCARARFSAEWRQQGSGPTSLGGFTDDKDIKVQRPGKVVKPGPSGKIDPE